MNKGKRAVRKRIYCIKVNSVRRESRKSAKKKLIEKSHRIKRVLNSLLRKYWTNNSNMIDFGH